VLGLLLGITVNKKLLILIVIAVILIGGVLIFKSQNIGTQILWNLSSGGKWLFPLVTAGALIDSINPCAFSVLLLTIAFLFSLGQLRARILKIGTVYVLGIFLIYLLIGLGILQTLHFFNTPHFMAKLAAWLLIILGVISIINEFFPSFPIKLKIPAASHHRMAQLMEKASLPSAFLLGGLVGLCEFPCTGGPYLMVLGLLHDKATFLKGLAYLIYYNLIFILPLVIILMIGSNRAVYDKIENWRKQKTVKMQFLSGLGMIILGIIILML